MVESEFLPRAPREIRKAGLFRWSSTCRMPLVKGNREGEELFFTIQGVDHFDVNFGVFEWRIIEPLDVVEEIACNRGVRVDGRALKAEVGIVVSNFFVDRRMVDRNRRKRNLRPLGLIGAEEATIDVVESSRGNLVAVGGDELHTRLVEVERCVGVIRNDDADGNKRVTHVRQSKEVTVALVVTGVDGDGDLLIGMGVEGWILVSSLSGRRLLFTGLSKRGAENSDKGSE